MRLGVLLLALLSIAAPLFLQQPKPAPDPAPTLSEAQALYRKGSFDQALARYNDILKADPSSGDAYAGIIRCYLKQDKVQEADDTLQKALHTVPAHPEVRVAEGEILFRQGEIPEAGKLFDEVIASPPDPAQPNARPNARAYLGAARVADANAMYAREHILISRAHALDGDDPEIRRLWIEMLSPAARIQSLGDYLAQATAADEETRGRLRARLDFLKASQQLEHQPCRSASEVKATKVPLRSILLGNGGASGNGLNVLVNGKTLKLLLDTGATGILIGAKPAMDAGLKGTSEIHMSGIGDKPDVPAHLAYADSFQIGEMQFLNCPVVLIERVPRDSDGIIGADVFSHFLIEMDFPNSLLTLSPLPPRPGEQPAKPTLRTVDDESAGSSEEKSAAGARPVSDSPVAPRFEDRYLAPEMHSYVQIFRIGHMLLVPTTIDEKSSRLFLLDTGAFDNTITPEAAREVTKVHRAPRVDVRGLNGEVKKVYVADQVTLDFGHLRQTVPNIVSIDMSRTSRQAGTEISGTLGMAMLGLLKVRLDYRDALADFHYTPKPARH